MNIAEAERRTGLSRANIRFYEKEGLLTPTRGANGYRDYTEDDVQTLRKIMLLRRLRLSVRRSARSRAARSRCPKRQSGSSACYRAIFGRVSRRMLCAGQSVRIGQSGADWT